MQTNFTAEQRADPRIAEADRILRSCVHCGLCTATCPTYLVLGDERDSPRGRIYLIKDMLEGGKPASADVARHVDRCLSCLSCMTTCPGGVDYMHLVDLARARIHETAQRPAADRLQRWLVARTVPRHRRFGAALLAAQLAKPFAGLIERLGLKPLAAMIRSAPVGGARRGGIRLAGTHKAEGSRKRHVVLLAGCAQRSLRPDINDATIRLLTRLGIDVTVAADAGCCGALVHHLGREEEGRQAARRNIDAWGKVSAADPVDAVLVNASGCGTQVKDYGYLLKADPAYAEPAARISSITRDVTEFLAAEDFGPPLRWSSLNVAYHSACSMQHGQQLSGPPRTVLRRAGFSVVEIAEGHICCGSAGSYSLLQPDLSQQLKARKIANIEQLRPDAVATGNIGCLMQIAGGTEIPVVHTIELIDWAYGGPVPRGLEAHKDRVREVPKGGPAARPAA